MIPTTLLVLAIVCVSAIVVYETFEEVDAENLSLTINTDNIVVTLKDSGTTYTKGTYSLPRNTVFNLSPATGYKILPNTIAVRNASSSSYETESLDGYYTLTSVRYVDATAIAEVYSSKYLVWLPEGFEVVMKSGEESSLVTYSGGSYVASGAHFDVQIKSGGVLIGDIVVKDDSGTTMSKTGGYYTMPSGSIDVSAIYGNTFTYSSKTIYWNVDQAQGTSNRVLTIKLADGTTAMPDFSTSDNAGKNPWFNPGGVDSVKIRVQTRSIDFVGSAPTKIGNCFCLNGLGLTGTLVIPDGVETIGAQAFQGANITSITFPSSSLRTIGESAFTSCISLTSVALPSSVTLIGQKAFRSCSSLSSLTIPSDGSNLVIDGVAFAYCNLSEVTIPNRVTKIACKDQGTSDGRYVGYDQERMAWAFTGNPLTSLKLEVPDSGTRSFKLLDPETNQEKEAVDGYQTNGVLVDYDCRLIFSITLSDYSEFTQYEIPSTVECIMGRAFAESTSLVTISYTGEQMLNTGHGSLVGKPFETFKYSFIKPTNGAFSGSDVRYADLSELTLTGSETDRLFTECGSLETVYLPVTTDGKLGNNTFGDCTALRYIELPEGYTALGRTMVDWSGTTPSFGGPFQGCSKLETIVLPASLESIDPLTFHRCYSLQNIILKGDASKASDPDKITLYTWTRTSVTEENGQYYFTFCTSRTTGNASTLKIYTPNGANPFVDTAGNTVDPNAYPFSPDGVHKMNGALFKLTTVEMVSNPSDHCIHDQLYWDYDSTSKNLTIFGYGEVTSAPWESAIDDFSKTSSITGLDFHEGVTGIASGIFSGYTGMNGVETYTSPSGISTTGLVLPDTMASLSDNAFKDCSSLVVFIGTDSKLASIGSSAFESCTSSAFSSVNLPPQLASLGTDAFKGCSYLTEIYIYNPSKFTLGSGSLDVGYLSEGRIPPMDLKLYGYSWVLKKSNFTGTTSSCTNIGLNLLPTIHKCGDKAYWSLISGELIIDGTGPTWSYLGDTGMDLPWATDISTISKVTVTSGITHIGDYLFSGLTAAGTFDIKSDYLTIGSHAFENSKFGNSDLSFATSIGDYAFSDCTYLVAVNFGPYLESIGKHAFEGSGVAGALIIGDSVQTIGEYAFYKKESTDSGITALTLGNSTEEVGDKAFAGNQTLNRVIILGSGNVTFGDNVFASHTSGSSFVDKTYYRNSTGDSVTLVGFIFKGAVYTNNSSSGILVGSNLTAVLSGSEGTLFITGSGSFYDDVSSMGANLDTWKAYDPKEVIIMGATSISTELFNKTNGAAMYNKIESLTISNGTPTLGSGVFAYCSALKTLNVPIEVDCSQAFYVDAENNVDTLKDIVFSGTTGNDYTSVNQVYTPWYLSKSTVKVSLSQSVSSVGDYTFSGIDVSYLDLSQIRDIGSHAFSDSGFTGLNIDASFVAAAKNLSSRTAYMGADAFSGCNINSISVKSPALTFTLSVDGIASNFVQSGSLFVVTLTSGSPIWVDVDGNWVTSFEDGETYTVGSLTPLLLNDYTASVTTTM